MIYFAPLNSRGRVRDKLILCQDLVKTSGFVPIISIPVIKIYPPPEGNLDHFCIFADFREIIGRTHVLKVSINNYGSYVALFWEGTLAKMVPKNDPPKAIMIS
jgi:hypothetical protein